jgi:protein involved in polysaccharide export with SLBB domain
MRSSALLAATALLLLAGVVPLHAQGTATRADMPDDVRSSGALANVPMLMPGDAVRITVWRKPELSGEFLVSADSTVAEPFYMSVKVAGVPLGTAVERLRSHVARYESQPQVLVQPLFRVTVGGAVLRPNLYNLTPSTTISEAVILAGGPTAQGDLDRVWLHRDGTRMAMRLSNPSGGQAQLTVRSGDYIEVRPRQTIFRDYVLPTLSAAGAIASIVRFLR